MRATCTKPNCGKPVNARGLCHKHYCQAQTAGEFGKRCTVPDCTRSLCARGMCNTHYAAAKASGLIWKEKCKIAGCDRTTHARRLCSAHYRAAHEAGEFGAPKCSRDGCGATATHRGMCSLHHRERVAAEPPVPCRVKGCGRRSVCRGLCARCVGLERRYGIDATRIATLINAKCDICGDDADGVDHCHATGAVRGALCTPCNLSLGLMRDKPNLLRRAAKYVERWSQLGLPLRKRTLAEEAEAVLRAEVA